MRELLLVIAAVLVAAGLLAWRRKARRAEEARWGTTFGTDPEDPQPALTDTRRDREQHGYVP